MTSEPDEIPSPVEPIQLVELTPPPQPRPLIPTRTLPLFLLFLAVGAVVLSFAYLTVHHRSPQELSQNSMAQRSHFSIDYWLQHGYFRSGGLAVRTGGTSPLYYHRSSTGGRFITGFIVEKIYFALTGHTSWRLLALHNQVVSLLTATLLGLLGFRLAVRTGATPPHAFVLALCVQAVHFTFPDNLSLYWGTTGREWFLLFAAAFLLLDERGQEQRTRTLDVLQAVAAFFLVYMEYLAGIAFIVAYIVATLILGSERATLKRMAMTCVLPLVLALGVFGSQLAYVHLQYPKVPKEGSGFLTRTGMDGDARYYGDHLDIAYGRNVARQNFPHNRPFLFRWPWLFYAGATALVITLIAAMRGRVPRVAVVALISLLGAHFLYAALFSQAVVIHPYLFDVLLFTPLALALFAVVPALAETSTDHRGIAVLAVFFLAVWVSMVQLRRFAMQYPIEAPKVSASSG
jgi:hypothetical protein